MDGRQRQVDLSTIRCYWSVAEELYAAGHPLHAFATLQSLVGTPSLIPPYYRREEIVTRVRAAEMLLHDSSYYSHPQGQHSKEGNAVLSVSSSSAIGSRLDLVQPVLSPMFATPRYFENTLFCTLLRKDNSSNCVDNNKTCEENEEDDDGEHLVPISLIVKAHVLNAVIHRRRFRYAQAVSLIESAQQWCVSVFSRKRNGSITANTAKAYQRATDEERSCCEAFLSVELCRVYYSQLMGSGRQASSLHRSEAALHKARATALDCLLNYAKDYAKYAVPHRGFSESPAWVSPLCLSSEANPFSQRAAAQTLGYYYIAALVISYRPVEAEMQLRQCEEHFGPAPEFAYIAQLLAAWHRGPRAVSSLSPANNSNGESSVRSSTNGTNSVNGMKRPREEVLRWTSDGLLRPLHSFLALHEAVLASGRSDGNHNDYKYRIHNNSNSMNNKNDDDVVVDVDVANDTGAGGGVSDCANDPESHSVWRLFRQTLQGIDEHLTQLTTGHVARIEEERICSRALHSSPSADIRFLVLLKCASLVAVTGHALGQLRIRTAVQQLLVLRRYMSVFRRHTSGMRVHFHLLCAQLAQFLSIRHFPNESRSHSNSPDRSETQPELYEPSYKWLGEKAEEESTAAFDVGLPYAHALAAEEAARDAAPLCDPAALLLLSITKGLALHHASHIGAFIRMDSTGARGFVRGSLTLQQRHRCAAALARALEALQSSAASSSSSSSFSSLSSFSSSPASSSSSLLQRQQSCAWTPRNRLLLRLLRGAMAMAEEHDEFGAAQHFREALRVARTAFGPASGTAAECLQLLAVANRAQERTPAAEAEEEAQETMHAAWQAAKHASRLALMHCAMATAGGVSGENDRIVEEWDAEVSHICQSMHTELLEVLSI